ncbi:hypothetical protein NEHOM01_1426 [Nematocida homosporus]|uniref:uncharacterized protein n=1 Tax=Nematocida homosporus TaxID=1912981 RepID=UPI00221F851C|nr:uncharacterized protein NEHOM01_1426 [Nematocida homosporus]KAI5186372.1 hypothetical protein NEHOM01_1426 [Nematocida homosporus]
MDHNQELEKMENANANSESRNESQDPNDSQNKKLLKIVSKPQKKRDNNKNEDSDKSGSESDVEETNQEIIKAALADEQAKKSLETAKEQKRKHLKNISTTEKEGFSIFSVESYIESNFKGHWFYLAMLAYLLVGTFLIMVAPSVALVLKKQPMPKVFVAISEQPDITSYQKNFKLALFFSALFITYLVLREIFNQTVYMLLVIHQLMGKKITKDTKVFLFIANDIRSYLAIFFFFLLAVVHCNLFLDEYWITNETSGYGSLGGYCLCLALLTGMFILEKFFLKITVAYFGNNVFSSRIGDVNLKLSIVRRLWIYSDAVFTQNTILLNTELLAGLEVNDSFLLHYDDFKIRSSNNCQEIIESIYQKLGVEALTEEHIRSAFGGPWEDIWSYLTSHVGPEGDEEVKEISLEGLAKLAKLAYSEKVDLKRTLYDRDNLLGKLDSILVSVALIVTLIVSTPLIGFDPIKYMAGIIPLIMSSGWLFSDIIKDVFNNFIFLLHEHPFDVGDRIMAKGEELTVLRIELMYSTFTSRGGTVCYIPNKELIKENIFNMRRSDIQSELVTIIISEEMKIENVQQLRTTLTELIKHKELENKKNITIYDYELQNGHTTITFKIEYLSNFQDPEPRFTRRSAPIEVIQKSIKDNNLTYLEQKSAKSL